MRFCGDKISVELAIAGQPSVSPTKKGDSARILSGAADLRALRAEIRSTPSAARHHPSLRAMAAEVRATPAARAGAVGRVIDALDDTSRNEIDGDCASETSAV